MTTRLFPRGGHNTILAENEEPYFEAVGEFLAGVRAGATR